MGSPLTWGADISVAIPTMPERRRYLGELLAHLPATSGIVMREQPEGGSPREDLPDLVRLALQSATGSWILLLEDDVWPAPCFTERVPTAFAEADAMGVGAVSFFSRSRKDAVDGWRRQGPASFCMMQAIGIRRHVLVGFPEWAPSWYRAHPQHIHAADLLLGAWLSRQRAKLLVHVPSLVQHRALPSTLPGRHGIRQSESYRRAFGEVPS